MRKIDNDEDTTVHPHPTFDNIDLAVDAGSPRYLARVKAATDRLGRLAEHLKLSLLLQEGLSPAKTRECCRFVRGLTGLGDQAIQQHLPALVAVLRQEFEDLVALRVGFVTKKANGGGVTDWLMMYELATDPAAKPDEGAELKTVGEGRPPRVGLTKTLHRLETTLGKNNSKAGLHGKTLSNKVVKTVGHRLAGCVVDQSADGGPRRAVGRLHTYRHHPALCRKLQYMIESLAVGLRSEGLLNFDSFKAKQLAHLPNDGVSLDAPSAFVSTKHDEVWDYLKDEWLTVPALPKLNGPETLRKCFPCDYAARGKDASEHLLFHLVEAACDCTSEWNELDRDEAERNWLSIRKWRESELDDPQHVLRTGARAHRLWQAARATVDRPDSTQAIELLRMNDCVLQREATRELFLQSNSLPRPRSPRLASTSTRQPSSSTSMIRTAPEPTSGRLLCWAPRTSTSSSCSRLCSTTRKRWPMRAGRQERTNLQVLSEAQKNRRLKAESGHSFGTNVSFFTVRGESLQEQEQRVHGYLVDLKNSLSKKVRVPTQRKKPEKEAILIH